MLTHCTQLLFIRLLPGRLVNQELHTASLLPTEAHHVDLLELRGDHHLPLSLLHHGGRGLAVGDGHAGSWVGPGALTVETRSHTGHSTLYTAIDQSQYRLNIGTLGEYVVMFHWTRIQVLQYIKY